MGHPGFVVLIAVLGGLAITMQARFMGVLDQRLGTLEGVFIAYMLGAGIILVPMLCVRGGNLGSWQEVPWYTFTAGALGLVIVGSIGYSVPRLGLVAAFTILTVSQFASSIFLDHFGLLGGLERPLEFSRLLGVAVLLVGAWLVLR